LISDVLQEIQDRGPIRADELKDRGHVNPIDWNGWKGTAKASSMALEILWTRCLVVVAGRKDGAKVYDVPERALPKHCVSPKGDFLRWAVAERVEAAGLLSRAGGSVWSMLTDAKPSAIPEALIDEGLIQEVVVEGSSRRYLAPQNFQKRRFPTSDGRMRILGPLDPILWDRNLIRAVFGFDYVWEVYKPASQRRWGWYVCPLLQGDRFVGRLEGRVEGKLLKIERIWREAGPRIDETALDNALQRHAEACGAESFQRPRRLLPG
jgi:uncharacterized protein